MVQILPSTADQLAPSIEGFAKGLEQYMKPNLEFQKAMQKAVGANPQLAQQLADLEYNAPGTLDNMGFGELGKVLSKVPESEKSQFMRTSRGDILDEDKKKLALEKAQTGFSFDRLMDTMDLLSKNPMVHSDSIMKSLGLSTAQETKTAETGQKAAEASTAHTEASTKALTTQQPALEAAQAGIIAKGQLDYKALDDVLTKYPDIHGMDPMKMVRDMMAGKSVPELQSYMLLPGGHEAIATAQTIYSAQANRDERELLHAQMNQKIGAEEKQNIIQAGAALRASGRAGTLAAWRTVLEHPDVVESIRKKKPEDLLQPEKDIIHAADAQDDMQDRLELKDVNQINFAVRQASMTAQSAVKQAESPAGIDLALVPLNNVLSEKGRKTGEHYQAIYGPAPEVGQTVAAEHTFRHPFTGAPPSLFYVDQSGKRVEDNAPFMEKKTSAAKMDAVALAFLSQYEGDKDPAHKAAQLEKLRVEQPTVYAQIKTKVKIK